MKSCLLPLLALTVCLPLAAQEARQPSETPEVPEVTASDDPASAAARSKAVPLEEIRHFVTTYEAIRNAYVEPRTDAQLMHSAVRGLLLELDPHSVYFDRDDAAKFDEQAEGRYEGIGIEVQQQPDGTLKITAPMDGSPAQRAGLKPGDVITRIDGKSVNTDQGNEQLRGKAGTSVRLSVRRRGQRQVLEVRVVRARIVVPSVQSQLEAPGLGVVRVAGFQSGTALEFEQAIERLSKEAGGRLRGLLIDLRSNPGGLLNAAVQMADDLIERGPIVSTRGRLKQGDTVYDARPGDLLNGAPVVVLVDAGSASAAEVLAGALQDSGRARIVGSRSFGKGSVQSVLPLDNGDAVKLTTARYYTPKGRSIQGVGIKPDAVLHADGRAATPVEYRESALPGHLTGEDELAMAGETGGEVLDGAKPLAAALDELRRLAGVAAPAPTPVRARGRSQ